LEWWIQAELTITVFQFGSTLGLALLGGLLVSMGLRITRRRSNFCKSSEMLEFIVLAPGWWQGISISFTKMKIKITAISIGQ